MPTKKIRTGKKVSNPTRQLRPGTNPGKGKGPELPVQEFSGRTPNPKYVSHERGAAEMWQSGTL